MVWDKRILRRCISTSILTLVVRCSRFGTFMFLFFSNFYDVTYYEEMLAFGVHNVLHLHAANALGIYFKTGGANGLVTIHSAVFGIILFNSITFIFSFI